MRVLKKALVLLVALSVFSLVALGCTTIIVTAGASADGSVMVTHTADCGSCDFRLVRVPAADYEPGSQRAVYPFVEGYPRYVGKDMGPGYDTPGFEPSPALGYIPQVEHTYAYFDAVYGVINEHQLAIGECTTAGKSYAQPTPGECIFDIAALSRVAMERCTEAREAIELMGALAVEYGYYGWGETLTVCDTKEAWVLEMTATPDKKSALWVAKKVPDGEVFVESNEFRIREVLTDDPDMLYSPNLHDVAAENGWWDPNSGEPLDWLEAVSPGEYSHPYYSLRRVWSVLRRVAPSLNLSPYVEDTYSDAYPFSVKPDQKLTVQDVFELHRDYYEGTEFDLTKGLAAGPFGTPNRYGGDSRLLKGAWERPVSIFRCDYSFVAQLRDWLPDPIGGVLWWGPDAPHTTAYVPFYCATDDIPDAYDTGSHQKFDPSIAFWVHSFAGNWADLKFSYIIKDIEAMQAKVENREVAVQPAIESAALQLYELDPQLAIDFLTDYSNSNAEKVVEDWWEFGQDLIRKYNDGYVDGKSVGYPDEWLKLVGYEEGPIKY
ncbi:MAG TPA: C69 family dipeptidase [Thermotogota bacterium]|nr:C69 family dipeptidase [Thermotogota bacterium]